MPTSRKKLLRPTAGTLALVLLLGLLGPCLCAEESPPLAVAERLPPAPAPVMRPARPLTLGEAGLLGLIEGATEFLPVSSTGHLILANALLGLDDTTPLADASGRPLWVHPPRPGDQPGEPLTMKAAADSFSIIVQAGAIAAVALLYHRALLAMLLGALGKDPRGRRLLSNTLLAFLPAAGLGYALHGWIETHLFSVPAVLGALVAGAVLMLWVERRRRSGGTAAAAETREAADLSPAQALGIGLAQCAALWPGTSRSMMAIVGGYAAGLGPRAAAEFSFLLGFVTLSAASGYKVLQGGGAMVSVLGLGPVLLGAAVATVAAAASVRLLVAWLTRRGLGPFAIYRLALAALLALWWFA